MNIEKRKGWKRKTPLLEIEACKEFILKDTQTGAFYRWSRSKQKWREISLNPHTLKYKYLDVNPEYARLNETTVWNVDMLARFARTRNYTMNETTRREPMNNPNNKISILMALIFLMTATILNGCDSNMTISNADEYQEQLEAYTNSEVKANCIEDTLDTITFEPEVLTDLTFEEITDMAVSKADEICDAKYNL